MPTTASRSSRLRERRWSASRLRAGSARRWIAACPSTRLRSWSARRNATSRWWWRVCAAPAFRSTARAARAGPTSAGRSFLALLHCAEERLSATRFAEYLSLGQLPEDEEPRTPAAWERLLVDAAVIGGPDRWEMRLDGLREEFHRRYREEEDEMERARLERRIVSLENLRAFALPVIERLAALPERATWGEWIAALTDLAEFTLREPERVTELLEELEPMSEIGPVGLAQVLLVIGPRLSTLAAAPKDSRFGKVWVGGIEEARGMAFRCVFVPGVNEGLFPRPPAEDPLLLRGAARVARRRTARRRHRTAAHRRGLRERAVRAVVFAAGPVDGTRARAVVLCVRGASRGGRAGDRRARIRGARAVRHAHAHRMAGAARPGGRHRRRGIRSRHAGPAGQGLREYLKSLPGRAVASLRARWMRWHKPWKPADGLFVEEIGSDALKPYRLTERAWSPSVLQQYARCPYRFALRGILGLASRGPARRHPADGSGGPRQSLSPGAVRAAARAYRRRPDCR